MGQDGHDRETDAKDFEKNGWSGIGKTEGPRWNPIGSSMSIRSWRVAIPKDFSCQWIPRQNLRAEAERLHPSYTLWVGMDITERPTQDFEKNGWSGIGKTEGPRGGILLDPRCQSGAGE